MTGFPFFETATPLPLYSCFLLIYMFFIWNEHSRKPHYCFLIQAESWMIVTLLIAASSEMQMRCSLPALSVYSAACDDASRDWKISVRNMVSNVFLLWLFKSDVMLIVKCCYYFRIGVTWGTEKPQLFILFGFRSPAVSACVSRLAPEGWRCRRVLLWWSVGTINRMCRLLWSLCDVYYQTMEAHFWCIR